ncbi:mitochondrial ribonuclease P catalytic subunit isoform X2 [Monomorium pharaonis]|uniref:mitochondrial ribonuclease P catalytic subunit isoform X2 n=1 Tax=Monomorium pharaonis TaxID=307658 RepID=UPI001745DA0F|nr:mitochondrial ribonuclease P catalytic subunit isoform X2 [Monomorium pharaonis]
MLIIKLLIIKDEWEKILEIIEMIRITTNPGSNVYSALVSAAFRNGKPDVAWKALANLVSCKLFPHDNVYTSHLQYCQLEDTTTFNNRMGEIFNFWTNNGIIPHNQIISAYADAASKHGWSIKFVIISKTGNCNCCGYYLSKITFTEKEFQKLAKSVMDRVIIGSDIYCKTNPEELLRFQKFIENTKPYDIVIDGLNLTYAQSKTAPKLLSLINVVEHFNKQRKKILVLTRKHQKKLSVFKQIERHAHVFFLNNLSADDPYIIYATMASGMNAMFVSLDLMRQHSYSLQNEHLQQQFKKWQYSHQYFIKTSRTGIRIQEPFACMPIVQKTDNGPVDIWHVPYVNRNIISTESYVVPEKWYCFEYNKKK